MFDYAQNHVIRSFIRNGQLFYLKGHCISKIYEEGLAKWTE